MREKTSEPFSITKENKQLLEAVFSEEKMKKYSKKEINQYFKSIVKRYRELETSPPLDHNTIQEIVANYFVDMGWNVRYETAYADFDYNYRFDIMAKKGTRKIVVEVKPVIDREALGQILEYIFSIKKEIKNAKFFLATDILSLPFIFNNGIISDILVDFVEKHSMGIILVDSNAEKTETWLIPSEFILA